MENENKKVKEMARKWETLGFLDGLKGHIKENIANLYEGCRRMIKNEETGEWECCKEGINCDDKKE
jgi:hypothetical protein